MRFKLSGSLCAALLLLMFSTVGCSAPVSSSKISQPSDGRSAMPSPARAIIYFQQQTSDSKQLAAAIAEACHCQPVFFRAQDADALIYEISLPQGQTFASFGKALMLKAAQLGIKSVEEDSVMQHQ